MSQPNTSQFNMDHITSPPVELIELILRELSFNDLFNSYGVSRIFAAVIDGSIHLRRTLWLEPSKNLQGISLRTAFFLLGQHDDTTRLNPLFRLLNPTLFTAEGKSKSTSCYRRHQQTLSINLPFQHLINTLAYRFPEPHMQSLCRRMIIYQTDAADVKLWHMHLLQGPSKRRITDGLLLHHHTNTHDPAPLLGQVIDSAATKLQGFMLAPPATRIVAHGIVRRSFFVELQFFAEQGTVFVSEGKEKPGEWAKWQRERGGLAELMAKLKTRGVLEDPMAEERAKWRAFVRLHEGGMGGR